MRTIYDGDREDICTLNHVGGVMVSRLASRALDRGLESQIGSNQRLYNFAFDASPLSSQQ